MNNIQERNILECIFLIRGQKVMIDRDLAELYGIQTFRLNEAVDRNSKRFPKDFMFKLTTKEKNELIANCDRFDKLKHSSTNPRAFTENGVAMLSSVLNSDRAIAINISIIRTFTKMRSLLESNDNLAKMFIELQKKHDQKDQILKAIYSAIDNLIDEEKENKKIGFKID